MSTRIFIYLIDKKHLNFKYISIDVYCMFPEN